MLLFFRYNAIKQWENFMPKVSDKKREKYVIKGGQKCPICKNEDLNSDLAHLLVVENGSQIQVPVNCPGCDNEWLDVYVLADICFRDDA